MTVMYKWVILDEKAISSLKGLMDLITAWKNSEGEFVNLYLLIPDDMNKYPIVFMVDACDKGGMAAINADNVVTIDEEKLKLLLSFESKHLTAVKLKERKTKEVRFV